MGFIFVFFWVCKFVYCKIEVDVIVFYCCDYVVIGIFGVVGCEIIVVFNVGEEWKVIVLFDFVLFEFVDGEIGKVVGIIVV